MTLPKEDGDLNMGKKRNPVVYCNKTTHQKLHAPVVMSTAHASTVAPAAILARPLRTLNNINSASHVIQLHPSNSPKLSGQRKTAVELLEESKPFYVKTERILDRKQELPHYSPGDRLLLLQHHPNRSPMLSLPSCRIREHHVFPAVTAAAFLPQQENTNGQAATDTYGNGSGYARGRDGYYTAPPVDKRRLSIRKDNPIPLNVTAVKRFLSRPGSTEENLQVRKLVPSKSTGRLIGFFESSAGKTGNATSPSAAGGVSPNSKKMRTRITFSEVLPCICQSNQPPELPHRMNKNNPSPGPPIPPKSPALNAKLRLLSQTQSQHHQLAAARAAHSSPDWGRPAAPQPFQQPQQSTPSPSILKCPTGLFRRIQSEEAPTSMTILPLSSDSIQAQRHLLLRNPILHKSLPDLNSPKNWKRGRAGAVKGGRVRSASTDLESCSDGGSGPMSRSSSVHLDSASNSSASDESSNEGQDAAFGRPAADGRASVAANRSERATTSDYASRSPSFKYETSSLVQTSQPWTLPPPWQDDSGIDPSAAESSTVEADQVRRKAILRSKSDVGPSRFAPDLLPAVPAEFTGDVPFDLDAFFDTIGQHGKTSCPDMMINTSGRSSPVYFSSVSSVDSYCKRRHVDNIYESSDSEDMAAALQRRLLGSQPGMGEPSIVERNARIIKWLIKCRNVPPSASIPASGSTGQLAKLAAASLTASPTSMPPLRSSSTHIPKHATVTAYYGQSTRL